jgi:hypothetical protein
MSRLEAWLIHVSTIVLTVTGGVYAYMHYVMKPIDPFSVVNHPLEPSMRNLHIIAAPFLVVAIGMILHSHILFKLENGSRSARKSGIFLIPLFTIMTASGYLLQITSMLLHRVLFWIHLVSGSLWAIGYVAHHLSSLKVRRQMLQSANSRKLGGNGNGLDLRNTISVVRKENPTTNTRQHR